MLRVEAVVVHSAVEDPVSVVVVVEVDDVIGDQMHGAMESAEDVVEERPDPFPTRPVSPARNVLGEETNEGVDVLGVDSDCITVSQLADLLTRQQRLELCHFRKSNVRTTPEEEIDHDRRWRHDVMFGKLR